MKNVFRDGSLFFYMFLTFVLLFIWADDIVDFVGEYVLPAVDELFVSYLHMRGKAMTVKEMDSVRPTTRDEN